MLCFFCCSCFATDRLAQNYTSIDGRKKATPGSYVDIFVVDMRPQASEGRGTVALLGYMDVWRASRELRRRVTELVNRC
jgi:hypothetical protein